MNAVLDTVYQTLLPKPQKLTPLSTGFLLDETCTIKCMTTTGPGAGQRLADLIEEEWGLRLSVETEEAADEHIVQLVPGRKSELEVCNMDVNSLHDEGYLLRVTANGAIIRAKTARGIMWGTMTLRQLIISQNSATQVQGVEIRDYPRYALRGFMIDSGRAPNSIPKLKRIIRICSAFKLNALFFREGDDEMNAVRYSTNALGSSNPHALAISELSELADYARAHGIDLIPEVESLGHSRAKGIHYPELVSGGFEEDYEGIGMHIRKAHLAACHPDTFALLESIYSELFAALSPPFIHLGLDEVKLPADKQAAHMEALLPRLFRCAQRHGIQASPIVWSDAPHTPDQYKSRLYRCLWSYADNGDVSVGNQSLARQGIEELSRSDCGQQVIMAGGSGSGHTPYSKSDYDGAYRNLAAWSLWGNSLKNHVGLLAVQWSGNMIDEWLPDFLAAADFGWNPPTRLPCNNTVERHIRNHLSRLADATSPRQEEIDPPAWDGIWLNGDRWDSEILREQPAIDR